LIETIDIKNQIVIDTIRLCEKLSFKQSTLRYKGFQEKDYDYYLNYSTSPEHLQELLNKQNDSPIHLYAVNSLIGESQAGTYLIQRLKPFLKFDDYYTAGYDPYGFVGWHTDTDISGYYIMMTYCPKGDGFFRYYLNDNIINLVDTPGWMTRGIKIPDRKDIAFWHCAAAKSSRFTFLFVFKKLEKYILAKSILSQSP